MDQVTGVFDQTAYERERASLPRFIVRPPQGDKSAWDHQHAWQLVYEWSVASYLDRGWECRSIAAGDVIVRGTMDEDDARRKQQRCRIEAWTDEFLASGIVRAITPNDREAVIRLAEARLREIVNDGFLVRALSEISHDG